MVFGLRYFWTNMSFHSDYFLDSADIFGTTPHYFYQQKGIFWMCYRFCMICGGRETPASDMETSFHLFVFCTKTTHHSDYFLDATDIFGTTLIIFINKWDNFGCVKGSVGMMCGGINISASDSERTFHFSYFLD